MKKKVYASIITIGDELLIGQVIDTNSAFIAAALNKIGVWMRHRVAVGDQWDDIWEALDESARVSDIILITGGLGPTADDITKPLLNTYFDGKMVVDEQTLQHVKNIFQSTNRPLLESNYKQAEVPDVCTVIPNKNGTAPGMLFEKNGKIFVSMPGVPYEMQAIMEEHVIPLIREKYELPVIFHKTLTTLGIGESFLSERLKDFEAALPGNINLAYLPNVRSVRLRLTATGEDAAGTQCLLDTQFENLRHTIEDVVVTLDDKTLDQTIAELLKQRNKTLSTAESCTGGALAAMFTETAGASQFFSGSVVCYSNDIKKQVLHISPEDIATYGFVSKEVATQMAANVRELMQTDYAIATTGILGPDGIEGKPVGTVWIAVANNKKVMAEEFSFQYNRQRNKEAAIKFGLNMLRKLILED